MLLHEWRADEAVDRDDRDRFIKSLLLARDTVPIGLVRTRHVERAGRLGAVLLIHGYGQNRRAWHLPLRSPANALARMGYDVFMMDLRGHGRSRDFGAPPATQIDQHVLEDVPTAVREVESAVGQRGCFLVGHSLGGLLAYASAPLLGPSVRGVVSLGSPYYFGAGQEALSRIGDWLLWVDGWVGLGRGGMRLHAAVEAVRMARHLLDRRWMPLPFRGFVPGSIEPDVLEQHFGRAMDFASVEVIRALFRAGVRQRRARTIGGLDAYASAFEYMDVPLLVVAGRYDDLAPPR
ncbi:MAG: alpha/beta hydrolase, partial [Myxococcota bacterium]